MPQSELRVLISGGGTGGHIFPAIAIANALSKMNIGINILFVGAKGRMEMEKVPAAGYAIEGLWISGLQRKHIWKNIVFPIKLLSSFIKANEIINRFKPKVVVGVGGYASGPILFVAARKGIPTLIQEQNSFPGITNRQLAHRVNKICVAYNDMERYFPKGKIVLTGNPVRQDILNLEGKKTPAADYFNVTEKKKTLLVMGGSQGARTINESIAVNLKTFAEHGIQLIWQTGKAFYPQANELVKTYEMQGIRAFEFITKMDYAYAIADVVISRAGASSISELCLVKKPAILVPSPNVAEDHQTKNAMTLVTHEAGILIKDADARVRLVPTLLRLINDEAKCMKLSEKIAGLGIQNATDRIAGEVLALAKDNHAQN